MRLAFALTLLVALTASQWESQSVGCTGISFADAASPRHGKKDRWYSVTDQETKKVYFWNKATGETSWTRPKGAKVSSGVTYHKHKNTKSNSRTKPPPPKKAGHGGFTAEQQAANRAAMDSPEAEEFELLDEEGDLIPPPPPVISYVFILAGVGALALVVVIILTNRKRDADLHNKIFKNQ